MAEDTTLSRWRHGFKSRWDYGRGSHREDRRFTWRNVQTPLQAQGKGARRPRGKGPHQKVPRLASVSHRTLHNVADDPPIPLRLVGQTQSREIDAGSERLRLDAADPRREELSDASVGEDR